MPVSIDQPEFLHEVWALFGVGCLILLGRFVVRLRAVGIKGLQGDDFFSMLVWIFYAMDASTVHLIYFLGTNVEAGVAAEKGPLSDKDIRDYELGSKLQLIAWYSYTALLWSLKGTMLCFFSRLTIGTWHNTFVKTASWLCALAYIAVFLTITFGCFPTHDNWQVLPDPGAKCTFKLQNFIVTTVLNVMTDGMIFCIPLPLLWTLQVPLKKKLVIGLLLSSGAFVIAAAIIRVVLTTSANPSSVSINSWGVRETIVGILTVNIPILRPIASREFWSRKTSKLPSSHGGAGASHGTGTKPSNITGSYELASSIDKGNRFGRKRQDSDSNGSQESIIGNMKTGGGSDPNAVTVQTTYQVSSDQEVGGDSWHHGRGGLTQTSVLGGKAPKL
ncbi:uncharacterized protein F5Z01DRAFT_271501 [Emericellopsis atlantica]|uniref:Rhodopsin domain-containing protein n=1 Tax=Emericellopsis atlantica TaxID=2614577 RepID=A0A9P7ZH36_9HYPO|nr:uncharacterized protein F5Z01DRAFT_271501 [Emericellopsis atlantica]KAG9251586.1 hypothetical protein F5Z01DRAFT_271501 [Emericellopsis atlantica]